MTQEEEIEKLKEIGFETKDLKIVNSIIYNLAAYGPKSIPAISQIIDFQGNREIRTYGLKTIQEIKQKASPPPYLTTRF
ncbi:MAG: hypothetical protein JSW00_10820 [Thermoplasmata archaeon]|nr:MAG: hypothetical protein JSW00_10820 [Thermoplasmata archaeon]